MKERLKKWWNRTWSDWSEEPQRILKEHYIVLRRTSNDGLVEFKKISKL